MTEAIDAPERNDEVHDIATDVTGLLLPSDMVSDAEVPIGDDGPRTPMTAIDELEAAEDDDSGVGKPANMSREATELRLLASIVGDAQLFNGRNDDKSYATLPNNGGLATAIDSSAMRRWLRYHVHIQGHCPVLPTTLEAYLLQISSQAEFDGDVRPVYLRIAREGSDIYMDLGHDEPLFVHVTAGGWTVTDHVPVAFRRSANMKPIPAPIHGESIETFRPFLNVGSEADFMLIVGWLLGALEGTGPFPILMLQGEQGCAKSTTARVLQVLIDDSTATLRAYPHGERDLVISASNSWILSFDNLSRLKPYQADELCRVATGIAFTIRKLYTDSDEVCFVICRPLILNGIDQLAERPDLLSRATVVELPVIESKDRRTEREYWDAFEKACCGILGALLDALSCALRRYDEVELDGLPRMADFVRLVTAAEPSLGWPAGSFARAFEANAEEANRAALDADPLSQILVDYMTALSSWGPVVKTPTEWLLVVRQLWPDLARAQAPTNPQALTNRIKRLAPSLRGAGIGVEFARLTDHNRTRVIRMWNLEIGDADPTSQDAVDAVDAVEHRDQLIPPSAH